MNSLSNLWPSPKFRFLAIKPRYQLVSFRWRVIWTFYVHIQICKPIPNANLSELFQGGNWCQPV